MFYTGRTSDKAAVTFHFFNLITLTFTTFAGAGVTVTSVTMQVAMWVAYPSSFTNV
jgi:hypothetical protein